MARAAQVSVFQWGYDGWGNATKQLVRSVDDVEGARGHEPPIFVDVRFSRSVRAIGFRDHAFERLLGHTRYRWMRSLGNSGLRQRKQRIQCPDAAHQLLDLALDANEAGRGLIFFCSCPSPAGAAWCHRGAVGRLLVRAARQRGVRVCLQEWPGGSPARTVMLKLPTKQLEIDRARRGAVSIRLGPRPGITERSLPWGALIELTARGDSQVISAGPAQFRASAWQLPILIHPVEAGDRISDLYAPMLRVRSADKLDPVHS
jgi:hypothetical protein